MLEVIRFWRHLTLAVDRDRKIAYNLKTDFDGTLHGHVFYMVV